VGGGSGSCGLIGWESSLAERGGFSCSARMGGVARRGRRRSRSSGQRGRSGNGGHQGCGVPTPRWFPWAAQRGSCRSGSSQSSSVSELSSMSASSSSGVSEEHRCPVQFFVRCQLVIALEGQFLPVDPLYDLESLQRPSDLTVPLEESGVGGKCTSGQVFERRCLVGSLPSQAPPAMVVDPRQRGVVDVGADSELETHGGHATQPASAAVFLQPTHTTTMCPLAASRPGCGSPKPRNERGAVRVAPVPLDRFRDLPQRAAGRASITVSSRAHPDEASRLGSNWWAASRRGGGSHCRDGSSARVMRSSSRVEGAVGFGPAGVTSRARGRWREPASDAR
jgi:hypothetical protein